MSELFMHCGAPSPTVLNFTVEAATADETDQLISETMRGYFGRRLDQAMIGPVVERETHAKVSGEFYQRTFVTDVKVTVTFLGYR